MEAISNLTFTLFTERFAADLRPDRPSHRGPHDPVDLADRSESAGRRGCDAGCPADHHESMGSNRQARQSPIARSENLY